MDRLRDGKHPRPSWTDEPTMAGRTDVTGALNAATGLLLFSGVAENPVGHAFLALLESLAERGGANALRRRAASFFRALAENSPDVAAGDAWQSFLIARILSDENPFSQAARRGDVADIPDGLWRAAEHDLDALGQLCALNGERLAALISGRLGAPDWSDLSGLTRIARTDDLTSRFAATEPSAWPGLLDDLAAHYRARGVGRFAQYRAFRWARSAGGGGLVSVRRPDPITFDDLIGYADQRQVVRRNTESFLVRRPANNLLLYGERGTGKSSTVKALLNAYADRGLRLVEVTKSALSDFPEIVELLADQPERFIVFVDDLSFDENETGYTELKALLEGGIEVRPENVVIYATSNRRHLILERFSDRALPSDEVRAQDTMQEKLSLADRFGVTVIFASPDQEQYLEIVRGLARRRGLQLDPSRLDRLALQWAAWNNGRSGRTARQFIDDLSAEARNVE